MVDSVTLSVPAPTVLRSNEREIPTGEEPVERTEHDFRRPRRIGSTRLDHAFTDLQRDADGLARVTLTNPEGDRSLALWVDEAYGYLMLFTGDGLPEVARRSIAVEPMTCPPNALRSGKALIRLEPGKSFASGWGISPS
jgi:aldose 1-epimerase